MKTLVISFSGGETSAFMTQLIIEKFKSGFYKEIYKNYAVVFANTGQEHEETLLFIKKFSEQFAIDVTWLESKTNFNQKKSSSYTLTNFNDADRQGVTFESMIEKYGIPNNSYLHCTRELKNEPIKEWCEDNFGKEYEIAIGIRLDEKKRQPKKNIYKTVYPLIDEGMTKEDVLNFWSLQSFRLNIENYQGNCQWCWKKSQSKLRLIAYENKEAFIFPSHMEERHGLSGHNIDGTKRVFFRGNKTAKDIIIDSGNFITDKKVYFKERQRIIDDYENSIHEGGCSESCEAFSQIELLDK